MAQQGRVLDTEGDIGDTVLINVILPVISVLNELIHPELRKDLRIVPVHQSGTVFEFEAQSKDKKQPSRVSRNICLDHALVLVDRRSFDHNWDPELREFLVVVEEKRIPFVRSYEWTNDALKSKERNGVSCLLPQILMYSEQFACSRFMVTSLEDSISISAAASTEGMGDISDVAVRRRAVVSFCAAKGQGGPANGFNPFTSGQSHALRALGIDALRSLGILDDHTFELPSELRSFRPRCASKRVLRLLKAGQEAVAHKHLVYAALDEDHNDWIANSKKPDRVEIRRQRDAGEEVPHPLPKRWNFL